MFAVIRHIAVVRHPVIRPLRRAVAAFAVAAGALLVVPLGGATPAGAQTCEGPPRTRPPTCSHQGHTNEQGAAASATLGWVGGAGSRRASQTCTLDHYYGPGGQSHYYFYSPPIPGHYEVTTTPSGAVTPTGNSDVWVWCVADAIQEPHDPADGWPRNLLRVYWDVPPRTPEDLVEYALAQLIIGAPTVSTSPGTNGPGLVGVPTWLMVAGLGGSVAPVTVGDDLLSVTVWANPDPNGLVRWNTGEAEMTCTQPIDAPEDCAYTYQQSSLGQTGTDAAGRPAYTITVSMTYIAGYSVSVGGEIVATVDPIGNVDRTSPPYYLAVEEAQAINTRGD